MLAMYYDEGKTMPEIAAELGVVTSTVSRTICRPKSGCTAACDTGFELQRLQITDFP